MVRSDLTLSVVMYIFNVSVSVCCGYPKSRISMKGQISIECLHTYFQDGENTIQELVDKHKVVLDSLLIELPEIPLPKPHEPVEKFKDQRSIGVALSNCHHIDVLMLDMAECS